MTRPTPERLAELGASDAAYGPEVPIGGSVQERRELLAEIAALRAPKPNYGGMRRFRIDREIDPTGVSGTGCVAQGVVFSDGTTVVRWLGRTATTTLHDSIESVEAIHLHVGASKLRWEDPICFACGTEIDRQNRGSQWCSACGATGAEPYLETRPDPSLGAWSKAFRIEAPSDAAAEERPEPGVRVDGVRRADLEEP